MSSAYISRWLNFQGNSVKCNRRIHKCSCIMLFFMLTITFELVCCDDAYDNIQNPSWFEFSWLSDGAGDDTDDDGDESVWELTHFDDLKEDIPIIIWWTDGLFIGDEDIIIECPKSRCYSTKNRKYMRDRRSRGFYFYGTDLDPEDMPLPRHSHHEWALFHEESPMNNYILVHTPMINLFNHTATFRRESDFPLTTHSLESLDYLTKRKPLSLSIKNQYRREGLSPVLYVQSHSDVPSDRDRYVKELMKYINVDSYGACLNNKEMPAHLQDPVESMESKEFLDFIARYKFHLSFENAHCDDYITEKLFRPFHVGSVPIHMGTKKATDWVPSNKSLILTHDFKSPAQLAEYLLKLDEDDNAYNEFLKYKDIGITNEFLISHMKSRGWSGADEYDYSKDMFHSFECHVCDQIFERHIIEKQHEDDPDVPLMPPSIAEKNHLFCPQPYTSIGEPSSLPSTDSWAAMGWINDYWNGLDKAMALRTMIESNETNTKKFMKYWTSSGWF